MDPYGDIIIEKLNNPLFFSYAKKYITTKYKYKEDLIAFEQESVNKKDIDEQELDDDNITTI